ncbi:MAG: hypothetical protein V9E96_11520 [Chitinophagaceae bacterium]
MSLIHLAQHVTEIGGWWKECLLQDELDFAKDAGERKQVNSTEELLALHDDLVAKSNTNIIQYQ